VGVTSADESFPYTTAAAFRAALRDRLSGLARAGGHGLDELQRQFAYDRLLARAFMGPDAEQWVLKGAGALLVRLPEARHSRDIDVVVGTATTGVPQTASPLVALTIPGLVRLGYRLFPLARSPITWPTSFARSSRYRTGRVVRMPAPG
jgi:hypothetical protein